MKIRTDFVTNSSTSNYGEVIIDNLVLLEILARYKAVGASFLTSIGVCDPEYCWGNKTDPDPDIRTLTPAICLCFGDDGGSCNEGETPTSLEEFLDKFIELILYDLDESELAGKLEEELQQREEEIMSALRTIKWYMRNERYDGRYEYWQFMYDQENGASYTEACTGCMDF